MAPALAAIAQSNLSTSEPCRPTPALPAAQTVSLGYHLTRAATWRLSAPPTGQLGARQGACGAIGADGKIVAAGVQNRGQCHADRVEIGDPGVHLGELRGRLPPQSGTPAGLRADAVPRPGGQPPRRG